MQDFLGAALSGIMGVRRILPQDRARRSNYYSTAGASLGDRYVLWAGYLVAPSLFFPSKTHSLEGPLPLLTC